MPMLSLLYDLHDLISEASVVLVESHARSSSIRITDSILRFQGTVRVQGAPQAESELEEPGQIDKQRYSIVQVGEWN
jgi:hypothetical protein